MSSRRIDDKILHYKVDAIDEVYSDIEDLVLWYYDIGGESSAKTFRQAVEQILKSLETFPRMHRKWQDDDVMRRVDMPSYNVALIYRIDDDRLEVIAIAAFHTLLDPQKYKELINDRLNMANNSHISHESADNASTIKTQKGLDHLRLVESKDV